MMDFKGSQTEANLWAAFAGESQATNKYTYFASKAKKDGYQQIAAIFEETASNEREHAKIWYKLLNDGIGETTENLKLAAEGESYEHTQMYPTFAKKAREEGFDEIADLFEMVSAIEEHHEKRYLKFLENIDEHLVFSRREDTVWICRNCGHVTMSKDAPAMCPSCAHPQSYFEILNENY